MKRRGQIPLGIGFILVLALGVYWQSKVDHKSSFLFFEPRYQGESLSYWVLHLYSYNPSRRLNGASADAILQIGTDALPLLLDWISRPEPRFYRPGTIEYQRHAVEAFEILGPTGKPAIPRLMKNVSNGSRYSMQALQFIGKDSVPPLADKLLETLADKRKPVMNWMDPGYKKSFFRVQVSILHGLREMGTNAEAAIPAVLKALNANHPWGLQWSADPYSTLACIGRNHPEVVIPALIDVLTNATAPAFNRGAIARAMASCGTNHAEEFLPVLTSTLNDKRTDDWNRRAMAGALADLGRNHPGLVVPVLIWAFTNTDIKLRDGIAEAMGAFGDNARAALPLLEAASQSPYFYLRQKAAIAVKLIAPEKTNALAILIKDLENRESGFRQQAIFSLGRLGTNGIEAIPALLKCLSHSDTQTRLDATRALDDIGCASDEFITALGENLSCTNHFTAAGAESLLGRYSRHSKLAFVTLLRKAVSSPVDRDVRNQAKYALINASREDPRFMLECLGDADASVRSGALIVFYDLARGVPAGIPKLRQLAASDPDSDVRNRAAEVLRLQLQN